SGKCEELILGYFALTAVEIFAFTFIWDDPSQKSSGRICCSTQHWSKRGIAEAVFSHLLVGWLWPLGQLERTKGAFHNTSPRRLSAPRQTLGGQCHLLRRRLSVVRLLAGDLRAQFRMRCLVSPNAN